MNRRSWVPLFTRWPRRASSRELFKGATRPQLVARTLVKSHVALIHYASTAVERGVSNVRR
jgi:hypothetical protein